MSAFMHRLQWCIDRLSVYPLTSSRLARLVAVSPLSCLSHQAASAMLERFYSLDLRQDQGMPAPVIGGHGISVLPCCSPTIRTPKEVPSRGPCCAPGLPTPKG